ncbi:uncharacterized beta-barrel protein YwiB (DUF1934 family) [Clostridium moniliforme]|uniref:Uncharacterized beta-barrel protein YwiB (DUF1934 family) n=1 Tax=Clostridium moniliforme TaxID=39489 RepID=A0ABS4F336_9CLOT|nr:DUF1934 domain-containing protein [Clostridium moniliforme]MBP1890652.1 uncharacterized beta-barrel protein YwiB (DUF1934 family) [Clostridium moniliforme]
MEKKAVIKIVSNATMEKGELIEVVTPGNIKNENDEIIATYKETEISGMDGTDTKLRIGKDYVILEREGSTTTKMHFQKDKQSVCLYNTPYGMLELTIDTKDLEIDVNEEGGNVEIKYEMKVADQPSIKTQLKLDIKA